MHRTGKRTVRPSLARIVLTERAEPPGAGRGPGDSQESPLALSPKPAPLTHLTWVLAASTPLDETDDEQGQHQEGDGTHEPNEPALGGDVRLVVGVGWRGRARSKHVVNDSHGRR